MKKLLCLILSLALPFAAIAGPEDHVPGAIYTTNSQAPYYLISLVFDTAKLTDDQTQLVIDTAYGNFSGNFPIISTSRHNEENISFTAKKIIINKWESGCGEGEIATITIKGQDNMITGVNIQNFQISVEYTLVNDTCHSSPQTRIFEYSLNN